MTNSLLSPSTLPFDLPDYAHLTDADFREAIEQGMAAHLLELDEIAATPSPRPSPTCSRRGSAAAAC